MPTDELDPVHEMCYECEGTGEAACPACGGTGEGLDGECEQCGGVGMAPCEACDGTGGEGPEKQRLSDYYDDMKMDQKRTGELGGMRSALRMPTEESRTFDKFMDDIVMKESVRTGIKTMNDSPQRARAQKYQDRPANKIKVGVK